MCLVLDKVRTKAAKEKAKTQTRVLTRYKIVRVSATTGHLYSEYRTDYRWLPGLNYSSRQNKGLTPEERHEGNVDAGIHVYASLADARFELSLHNCGAGWRLISVQCNPKDLIAVSPLFHKEEVYTKVTLTEATYKRALKPGAGNRDCTKKVVKATKADKKDKICV